MDQTLPERVINKYKSSPRKSSVSENENEALQLFCSTSRILCFVAVISKKQVKTESWIKGTPLSIEI